MKLARATSLLFACSCLASPSSSTLVARDDDNVVLSSLYAISNATLNLNNNITAFSVDTILQLQVVSASVVQTINAANAAVKNSPMLDQEQALALIPVLQNLVNLVNETVANVIEHKEAFGGVSPVVQSNIEQQQTATTAFTGTVATKLPSSLVSSSFALTAPIFASLKMGAEAFSTPNVNPASAFAISAATISRPGLGAVTFGLAVSAGLFAVGGGL